MWTFQLAIAFLLFSGTVITAQPTQRPIRINAGSGKQYRDSKGNVWSADDYYHMGKTFSELFWIFSTNDRDIYRSNRYNATYDIPVANGYYIVRMHFAETYSGAFSTGARVFDVEIEGQVVFPSLDVYAEAGGFTALIKETKAQVHDGTLSISFVRKAENPFISGIEVLPSGIPYVAPETKPPVVQDLGNEATPSTPAHTNQPTTAPKASSAIEPMGGIAVWGRSGYDTMRYSEFDGKKFVSLSTGPNVNYRWAHIRGASAPSRDEMIVVGVTDEGTSGGSKVTAAMWTENSWDRISIAGVGDSLGTVQYPYWNNAQVAYESQSGDGLLVWNDNGRLLYSEWNGKVWTTAASVSGIAGEPQWFDIASNPLSNEIIIVLSDSSNRVYVLVWNGSRWSNGPSQISTGSHQAGIAVAYESQSNRAMVVYGRASVSSTCQYRIWEGTRWSSEASLESPLGASTVQWVVLRSDPNSNRLVLGVHNGDEDAFLSVWGGFSWDKSATIKATTTSSGTQTNTLSVMCVGIESNSGDAVAVYRDRLVLRYRTLRKGSGSWSPSYDIPNYRETPTSITLDSEPGSNRIMLLVQDDDGDIHSVQWDGDSQSWNAIIKLETATGEWKNQPFSFTWKNPLPVSERTTTVTVEPTLSPTVLPTVVPTVSPVSSSPTNEPTRSPFGVDGFVLVNAVTNQDVEGAFDCDPINECVDLSGKFNIRASVFGGDIATVTLDMEGPIARTRTEDEPPYTIYDDRRGNHRGRMFLVGRYTMSAFATGLQGESSESFTMTFNVAHAPSASPSEEPSRLPSHEPTSQPSHTPSLTIVSDEPSSTPSSVPSGAPTRQNTPAPTEFPSPQPSKFPSNEPSVTPTTVPTSQQPIQDPTNTPSTFPTAMPSSYPTEFSSNEPSVTPTNAPTTKASVLKAPPPSISSAAQLPSESPSWQSPSPSFSPTGLPSSGPSAMPSNETTKESHVPSQSPSSSPTIGLSPTASPFATDSFIPVYINCGGREYTDSTGTLWQTDEYFNTGSKAKTKDEQAIDDTTNPELYRSERWQSSIGSDLIYSIPVQNEKEISVTLHFSENFKQLQTEGGRVFNVSMQGDVVFSNLDIFKESGGPYKALTRTKTVAVEDGIVTVRFSRIVQNPKVSGIELHLPKDSPYSDSSSALPDASVSLPRITSLTPDLSNIEGGDLLVISGLGFTASASETIVYFGSEVLSGSSDLNVVNETTIEVKSIPSSFAGSADVRVETPKGISNTKTFTYIDGTPIAFTSGLILKDVYGPTCVTIGNGNGKIYVGTQTGLILQIEVNEKYQVLSNMTSYAIPASSSQFRSILGIAIDPMDTSSNPAVYVSHSTLFHGKRESFNGAVSMVSGPNLDVVEDIVTGLPVSDLDHGVNGLVFGDRGELYINVGSNTNAGIPGPLSSSGKQKDAFHSGATLVAYLNRPNFQGKIELDENGDIKNPEIDVELFAVGLRNPYGIVLHSNGYLYATDNGPNAGFGRRSVTCDEDETDPSEGDELNLLERGRYYGHANRKRGETDPRQCTWRSQTETSDEDYTAPIATLLSSSDGIIEFQTDHFEGKLRGHLIVGKYKGGLFDVALSSDGRTAINKNATLLTESGGLSLAQGPDGTLFVARNDAGEVIFVTPKDTKSNDLLVESVFPRRGPIAGGSLLRIYGHNFDEFGTPFVTVGGKACPLRGDITDSRITCELPSGIGTVDIVVIAGSQTATFARGYRYISGE